MRISSSIQFEQSVKAMQTQQAAMAKLQVQIGASRKVLNPADDPVAASREVSLDSSRAFIEQMIRNQSDASDQISHNETLIRQSIDQLQSFRTRLIQAGNGILSEADRKSLVQDLASYREQLLSIANQQDASGMFLFSGFKGSTQPFVLEGDRVVYRGDDGIREVQVAPQQNMAVNFTGQFLFGGIPTGNGIAAGTVSPNNMGNALFGVTTNDLTMWRQGDSSTMPPTPSGQSLAPYSIQFQAAGAYTITDGQGGVVSGTLPEAGGAIVVGGLNASFSTRPADGDAFLISASSTGYPLPDANNPSATTSTQNTVFDVLDRAIAALSFPDTPQEQAQRANELSFVQQMLDNSIDRLLDGQTLTGTRGNQLDSLKERDTVNRDNNIAETTRLTGMTLEDMTAAISELTQRDIALSAAQKTFGTISRNSLFNYI